MKDLINVTVTDIQKPVTVFSYQNKTVNITNRAWYGLSFCSSGQITYTIDGEKIVSDNSCAILLPKGRDYTLFTDKEGIFPVLNFDCVGFECNTIKALPLTNPASCISDFEKLKSLFLFKNNRHKIYSVFYELLNKLYLQQISQNSMMFPMLRYIEDNISDPNLTNSMLARFACISEVYLRQLFKKEFGTTPKQYILEIRMEKAKQLLTDPAKKISVVAEECGFSSVYHFCREFKNKTGTTPGQYSKNNINTTI